MANKYEVVEMEKNTWNEDGSPSITNRWVCESATDAFLHVHVRRVEAEIQGRRNDVALPPRSSYFTPLELHFTESTLGNQYPRTSDDVQLPAGCERISFGKLRGA
jgi:hypothetical protein